MRQVTRWVREYRAPLVLTAGMMLVAAVVVVTIDATAAAPQTEETFDGFAAAITVEHGSLAPGAGFIPIRADQTTRIKWYRVCDRTAAPYPACAERWVPLPGWCWVINEDWSRVGCNPPW